MESIRNLMLHVPMWFTMFLLMGISFAQSIRTLRVGGDLDRDQRAVSAVKVGLWFGVLGLLTGSLWARFTWGAWWVWDARLTSQLILLFMYIGYIAYAASAVTDERISKAAAILALVGVINIPIIKYSVEWWNTLHQPASVFRADGPAIAPEMLTDYY